MATTAQTSTSPKKAFKILRLKSHHERPKILFDLPREIRDTIWSYALTEPTLYNKRHKPGCPFHDHAAAYQVPPALLHYSENNILRQPFGIDAGDLSRCKALCVRRQGFGLLKAVNKQIQHEASSIFWETTTITFPDPVCQSNNRTNALIAALKALPVPALSKIQKLALWQIESYSGAGYYTYTRAKLAAILLSMPNLTHLELPSVLLDTSSQDQIFTLPSLATFKPFALRLTQVSNGNDFVPLYLSAGQTFTLPPCRAKPASNWCIACQHMKDEILSLVQDLEKCRSRMRDWTEHAGVKLARLEPNQPGEKPYTVRAQLDNKRKDHQIEVWGLPIHSPATRALEARKAAKRENLANLVRRGVRGPVYVDVDMDGDGDFRADGIIFGRQRRAVEKRADHAQVLEDRGNHLRKVERKEKEAVKKEREMTEKVREKAKQERTMTKRARKKMIKEEVKGEWRGAGSGNLPRRGS